MLFDVWVDQYELASRVWPDGKRSFTWSLFPPFGNLGESNVQGAIAEAFNAWQSISLARFTQSADRDQSADFRLTFAALGSAKPTLGHTRQNYAHGAIESAVIQFNSSKVWTRPGDEASNTSYDLVRVAIHEIGHGLGLDHTSVTQAIMYTTYSDAISGPMQDDKFAIQALFNRYTLQQRSDQAPALAARPDGTDVLFWVAPGEVPFINRADSSEPGNFVAAPGGTIAELVSSGGVSVALANGTIVFGFASVESHIKLRYNDTTYDLDIQSASRPAMLDFGSNLLIAWTQPNQSISTGVWNMNESSWVPGSRVDLDQKAIGGPALARIAEEAVLVWMATDTKGTLDLIRSGDGVTWDGYVQLDARCSSGPAAVAADEGSLFICWTGRDNASSVNIGRITNLLEFDYVQTFDEASRTSPSIAHLNGGFGVAWLGTNDDHNLNVFQF